MNTPTEPEEVTRASIEHIKSELFVQDSNCIYYSVKGNFPIVFTGEAAKEVERIKYPEKDADHYASYSPDVTVIVGGYVKQIGVNGRYTFITSSDIKDAFKGARCTHKLTNKGCFLEITNIERRWDKKSFFSYLTGRLSKEERLDKTKSYKGSAPKTYKLSLNEYMEGFDKY